jgi:hypothetical protein
MFMNRMSRLLFSIVLVGAFACIGRPQAPSPLNLAIKVDNPIFQRGRPALVHAKIKWGAVSRAQTKTFRTVRFRLVRPTMKQDFCTRGDCYVATFSLPVQVIPKAGELIEFDVSLDELYWNDEISSLYDFSRPKNLFNVIPVAAYSMSTDFPANSSTKRHPSDIEVASNVISVEMQ